jgi:hypothetical protein
MGGLARRVGYTKALLNRSKGEVAVLELDAGHFLSDDRTSSGMARDVAIKNEWVLRGFELAGIAAANVTHRDLPFLGTVMGKDTYKAKLASYPMLDRLISANIRPASDAVVEFKPFIIKEISARRLGSKPIKVGILGLSEAPTRLAGGLAGYLITDPVEAAKKYVPELRKQCDLVVVLAYADKTLSTQIGKAAPGIDIIYSARQHGLFSGVEEAGDAVISFVINQTKYLSEMRLYQDKSSTTPKISNYIHRDVQLDDAIPDEPSIASLVDAARKEFTKAQQEAVAAATADSLARQRAMYAQSSPFVGADSCAGCHQEEYDIWAKSGHAHAMRTLEMKQRQNDGSCTVCHSVGQKVPGGFRSVVITPQLANVQCESCHTAGKAHLADSQHKMGAVTMPDTCVTCHTKENSPDFELSSYWARIKHGKGATPAAEVPSEAGH